MVDRPMCPRCGYDQTGTVDTWTDQCPLESLCPECGYTFAWSDVFYPDRQRLPGFFEHERGLWPSFVAAWRTMAWIILPFVFWDRVRMHHEVRVRRVLLWPIVVFGSLWIFIVAARVSAYFVSGEGVGKAARAVGFDLINAAVFPVMAVWEARWTIARNGAAVRTPGVWFEFLFLDWSMAFYGIIGQAVLVPLLLLLLPETRRRAKVRKAHILRAAVYGQGWLFFHLLLLLTSAVLGAATANWDTALAWRGPIARLLYEHRFAYTMLLAAWIAAWWYFALAKGFCLRHATFHWLVLMFAAVLVLLIALASDWRLMSWLLV
jgi:hypothetical protein